MYQPLRLSDTTLPGKIEAEKYQVNSGLSAETCTDTGGGQDMGYTNAGDYLDDPVYIPSDADFSFEYRVASTVGGSIELRLADNPSKQILIHTVAIPNTGGWQTCKTLQTSLNLTAGKHILRILTNKGLFNLNWIEITDALQSARISEFQETNDRVYPNPVKDKLFIESDYHSDETQLSILNLEGRVIFTKMYGEGTSKFEIDFSSFKSGSYIVQTKNAEKISNHLIIK